MNGHRDWGGPSEEHQPVTWLKGYPVYAAHLIMGVLVISMIATTVLIFLGERALLDWLVFDARRVLRGQVWRIASYGLVNEPSLRFAIDMVMLVWFGREVERFFGRRKFLVLFAMVYLITPLLLTAIGPWAPFWFAGKTGVLAIFIAFAALFPNVPVFFSLLAKWAAFALVGIYTLMALADRDLPLLISIWAGCGVAFAYVRYEQGILTLPRIRLWKRKPKLRVLPDLPAKKPAPISAPASKEAATMAEVDALLDKIAKSGIGSLTPKERAKLEAAREGLMKRGAGRG
jgi:membrane associated rhomboid family serine protease